MRYTVRKSVVHVIGKIWMPSTTAAQVIEMSDYDIGNAKDDEGKVTRESLELWLGSHAGDFAEITDFWASIEVGEETVGIEWADEESELKYNDCMFGNEDD